MKLHTPRKYLNCMGISIVTLGIRLMRLYVLVKSIYQPAFDRTVELR